MVKFLQGSVLEEGDPVVIEIRRSHLVKDAMKEARKKKFQPTKQLKVTYRIFYLLQRNTCKDFFL